MDFGDPAAGSRGQDSHAAFQNDEVPAFFNFRLAKRIGLAEGHKSIAFALTISMPGDAARFTSQYLHHGDVGMRNLWKVGIYLC